MLIEMFCFFKGNSFFYTTLIRYINATFFSWNVDLWKLSIETAVLSAVTIQYYVIIYDIVVAQVYKRAEWSLDLGYKLFRAQCNFFLLLEIKTKKKSYI